MTERQRLSAIVTSFNEEINIQECLESVLWADEVLLVDSFSTDRTVEVCREYEGRGVRVLHEPGRKGKTSALNRASQFATG